MVNKVLIFPNKQERREYYEALYYQALDRLHEIKAQEMLDIRKQTDYRNAQNEVLEYRNKYFSCLN